MSNKFHIPQFNVFWCVFSALISNLCQENNNTARPLSIVQIVKISIWTDLTLHFSLSIFTDFHYQSIKITWLLPIFIDWLLRAYDLVITATSSVPRVSSFSNMAPAGEKTLAHSGIKRSLISAFHGAFIHALWLVYYFQNKEGSSLSSSWELRRTSFPC